MQPNYILMYAFIFYSRFLSMLTLLLVSGEFVACSSILATSTAVQ